VIGWVGCHALADGLAADGASLAGDPLAAAEGLAGAGLEPPLAHPARTSVSAAIHQLVAARRARPPSGAPRNESRLVIDHSSLRVPPHPQCRAAYHPRTNIPRVSPSTNGDVIPWRGAAFAAEDYSESVSGRRSEPAWVGAVHGATDRRSRTAALV
jgi:hypothetical protein